MRSELGKWLDPRDPTLNHRRSLKLRTPETGAWLLEGDKYNGWKVEMPSFLWLYGSAGSGKTILSSGIINDLQAYCKDDSERALAYWYYDFNDSAKQDPVNMIRSLLYQFLEQGVCIPQSLQSAHVSCSDGQRSASSTQLLDAMHDTLRACPASYIVLDALDECTARVDLLDMLQEIHSWHVPTLHVIATSRKDVDIEDRMEKLTTSRGRICLESDVVDADIRTYVQTRLMHEESFRRWQKVPAVRDEIEVTLAQKARGMFRWAACQLDVLARCPTPRRVRDALNNLPATLNDTYARIIEHIDQSDYGDDALKILRWLVYSAEPLTTRMVMEVTGIFLGSHPQFDAEERYVDARDIVRACSSLISIGVEGDAGAWEDVEEGTTGFSRETSEDVWAPRFVRLAHFSVKEYLVSRHSLRPGLDKYSLRNAQKCHEILSRYCLVYLLRFETEGPVDEDDVITFPLADYAARYWASVHVRSLKTVSHKLQELMLRLLARDSGAFVAWTQLDCYLEQAGTIWANWDPVLSPVYAATRTGVKHIAQIALETLSVGSDAGRDECTEALLLAAKEGFTDIVDMLLDRGADVNALQKHKNGRCMPNVLQTASQFGRWATFEMLLERGASLGERYLDYDNPLEAAMSSANWRIVELLLDRDAFVNSLGGCHGSTLGAAVVSGNSHIIDKGANVNAVGQGMSTALQIASKDSSATIVKLLLDRGADVNAVRDGQSTALTAACLEGRKGIFDLLLDAGADINVQGGFWDTPLQAASSKGYKDIVKFLLDRGANVNARGGYYDTALQAAAHHDRKEVIEVLIKHGANVNAQGQKGSRTLYDSSALYGSSALHRASSIGSRIIVTMLLAAGAETNAIVQGDHCGTALNMASFEGHEEVVSILLDRGADMNATAALYGTALQTASARGRFNVVRLLLDRGADILAHGGRYGSALYLATHGISEFEECGVSGFEEQSRDGREKVSQLLRAAGAVEKPPDAWVLHPGFVSASMTHTNVERLAEARMEMARMDMANMDMAHM
ncbi:hypothetical protein LTS12_013249 [Elasticomyces elasticus]|nr:hypothetical protein LTS12_013249 [Elasticomyces elasticus]